MVDPSFRDYADGFLIHQPGTFMSTKDERFFKDMGARVAQLRKDQALTQAQLAGRLAAREEART